MPTRKIYAKIYAEYICKPKNLLFIIFIFYKNNDIKKLHQLGKYMQSICICKRDLLFIITLAGLHSEFL